MKNLQPTEKQRLSDAGYRAYQPTTLSLGPFEEWIEQWQVKLAGLQAEVERRRMQ